MTEFVVVYITCSNDDEADNVSKNIIEKRLAACCNKVPKISSLYWWQGNMEESQEVMLIIKTKRDLLDVLIEEVKKLHSYTVPEIIAVPIIAGNQDYLNWVKEETIKN